jgi:hypothetical protein
MRGPRICIAGIDWGTGKHLRPVTDPEDPMTRELLRGEGGALELGLILDLGSTVPDSSPPETEDRLCETTNFRPLKKLAAADYFDLLGTTADPDLPSAFGPSLQSYGSRTFAVGVGEGSRSLACIPAGPEDRLLINAFGKLKLVTGDAAIAITDCRLFEGATSNPRPNVVESVNNRLDGGISAYLMFGLARAWAPNADEPLLHWLQLNGICLEDDPLGETP